LGPFTFSKLLKQGLFLWRKIEVCLGILSHFGLISA
jgi:hypothetical protein